MNFPMLEQTWFLMPNWKWLAAGLALVTAFFLFHLLRWLLNILRERISRRFQATSFVGLYLRNNIHRPLTSAIVILFLMATLHVLDLHLGAERIIHTVLQVLMALALIRLAYMGANAGGEYFETFAKKSTNTLDDHLAPLLTRTMKIGVVALGALMLLQNVGVNVASILAGLGIGGLAVALAAQDTFANLFGSITIIFDRPFQIGDIIKVGDTEGTVEAIGLRSTRVRSATKTVISIPNSIMAKERIENLGQRTSRRCRHLLGVTYDTTPHKILEFIDHVRYILQQHPLTLKDEITVSFNGFGDSSLNILVNFYLLTGVYADEMKAQQEILVQIMQVAEHDGIDFAFPTRTLEISSPLAKALAGST